MDRQRGGLGEGRASRFGVESWQLVQPAEVGSANVVGHAGGVSGGGAGEGGLGDVVAVHEWAERGLHVPHAGAARAVWEGAYGRPCRVGAPHGLGCGCPCEFDGAQECGAGPDVRWLRAEGGEVRVPVDGRRETRELVDREGGVGRGAREAGVDVVKFQLRDMAALYRSGGAASAGSALFAPPLAAYTAVLGAVRSGRISTERLDASVTRILQLKWKRGLFAQPYVRIEAIVDAGLAKRQTASKWLSVLAQHDVLERQQLGRSVVYLNRALLDTLAEATDR